MRAAKRIKIIIGGLVVALVLISGVTYAQTVTVDAVITEVNTEYAAGNISDRDLRDNLLLILNDSKFAPTPEERVALVDSFKILISAHSGAAITTMSADALLTYADQL